VRFAYSNFVLPSSSNPGTFFGYKTAEYEEQIKNIKQDPHNGWSTWCAPVNGFIWEEPLELIEEKKKGITAVRYRDIH